MTIYIYIKPTMNVFQKIVEKTQRSKNFFVEAEVEVPAVKHKIITASVFAKNKNEALEKYKKELENNEITCVNVSKRASPFSGIVLLGVTVLMSFFKYYEPGGFRFVTLFPNITSILFSIIIYASFVIRVKGLENTFKKFADSTISILFILVMGIFIRLFAGSSTIPQGVIGKILAYMGFGNNYLLIFLAAALSWLGLKQICGFVWLAVIGLGFIEFATCGKYMGDFKGVVFILSAFTGIIAYLKYEGKLVMNAFKEMVLITKNSIGADIKESQKFAKDGISKIKSAIETREQSKEIEEKFNEEI